MEEGDVFVAAVPDKGRISILAPKSFVAEGDSRGSEFFQKDVVDGFSGLSGFAVKGHGGGGHKAHAEKDLHDVLDLAIRHTGAVAEKDGSGFGERTDRAVDKLPLCSLNYRGTAVGTKGLVMDERGDHGAGLQDDILLDVLLDLIERDEVLAPAIRTDRGWRDDNGLVDMVRLGAGPAGMAFGCAAWAFRF